MKACNGLPEVLNKVIFFIIIIFLLKHRDSLSYYFNNSMK